MAKGRRLPQVATVERDQDEAYILLSDSTHDGTWFL